MTSDDVSVVKTELVNTLLPAPPTYTASCYSIARKNCVRLFPNQHNNNHQTIALQLYCCTVLRLVLCTRY